MLRELLSIFRGGNEPLAEMGERFAKMFEIAFENSLAAGESFFGTTSTAEERSVIYEKDVEINQLERKIRKRVVAHLSIQGNRPDVPYCLLLMTLVKDVERIGDYAKNLTETFEFYSDDLPDDEIIQELREIRSEVEKAFKAATEIFGSTDHERAMRYIQAGRDIAHRCDALIPKIAKSDYRPDLTTVTVLACRYYKRIGGHVLNILTSVVMPLHKIDYYDEDEIKAD